MIERNYLTVGALLDFTPERGVYSFSCTLISARPLIENGNLTVDELFASYATYPGAYETDIHHVFTAAASLIEKGYLKVESLYKFLHEHQTHQEGLITGWELSKVFPGAIPLIEADHLTVAILFDFLDSLPKPGASLSEVSYALIGATPLIEDGCLSVNGLFNYLKEHPTYQGVSIQGVGSMLTEVSSLIKSEHLTVVILFDFLKRNGYENTEKLGAAIETALPKFEKYDIGENKLGDLILKYADEVGINETLSMIDNDSDKAVSNILAHFEVTEGTRRPSMGR